MKWTEFFKEYFFLLFSYLLLVLLFFLFFFSLHVDTAFLILYVIFFLFFGLFWFFFFYFKKRKFYQQLFLFLNQLPQKYFLHEMNLEPNFLEAQKLMDVLYEVDKSMKEEINRLNETNQNFRNYIEMWIHEIKIPLANLVLMGHNKDLEEPIFLEQLRRIESYIEQVLYYVRSEMVENDYLIQEYDLKQIVSNVIKKNKDAFIYGAIQLDMSGVSGLVLTDEKWLGFILNQILSNSIKYRKEKGAKIILQSEVKQNEVILKIWDNGIGITSSDLNRVFDKSFTGSNGRKVSSSTGMGLFICKRLIEKLGHQMNIQSKLNEFTEVTIIFSQTDFYDVF